MSEPTLEQIADWRDEIRRLLLNHLDPTLTKTERSILDTALTKVVIRGHMEGVRRARAEAKP